MGAGHRSTLDHGKELPRLVNAAVGNAVGRFRGIPGQDLNARAGDIGFDDADRAARYPIQCRAA